MSAAPQTIAKRQEMLNRWHQAGVSAETLARIKGERPLCFSRDPFGMDPRNKPQPFADRKQPIRRLAPGQEWRQRRAEERNAMRAEAARRTKEWWALADKIVDAVSAVWGFPKLTLISGRRNQPLAEARFAAAALMVEMTGLSDFQIARALNRRDHTVARNAKKRAADLALVDREWRRRVRKARKIVMEAGA